MSVRLQAAFGRGRAGSGSGRTYARRDPERSVLHRVVQNHVDAFRSELERRGRALPGFVQRELDRFVKCGDLRAG
ncbi:MAG: hypothetical protein HYY06_15710 [Deltaproteobacteria bacterium]|nr:hypothetical protein [Deltaproteobacteria bacterium]